MECGEVVLYSLYTNIRDVVDKESSSNLRVSIKLRLQTQIKKTQVENKTKIYS